MRLCFNIDASSVPFRTGLAFWLFGLINNFLYVIILSAALDLVGPSVPKGLVLLADVLPSFLIKLVAPYYIHRFTYAFRVCACVSLSIVGMLLIVVSPVDRASGGILLKLVGIALASLSGGGGELSFLGLTHFYDTLSLAAWASGSGAAGLVGAGAYVAATDYLGLSSRTTLIISAFVPFIMIFSYFLILPSTQEAGGLSQTQDYHQIRSSDTDEGVDQGLLRQSTNIGTRPAVPTKPSEQQSLLRKNLRRARALIIPYMLPLLLVYIAEYTINQGVAPTLLFPLAETPFQHFRSFYPAYNAIYQLGVFISRSSIALPSLRIRRLYLPSLLQCLNLLLLILQSRFDIMPNVYIVFAVIFWEGLLGGAVYSNTFNQIRETTTGEEREFSLSATTVSDSGGIMIAALLSMVIEKWLCAAQIARGRDWCTLL